MTNQERIEDAARVEAVANALWDATGQVWHDSNDNIIGPRPWCDASESEVVEFTGHARFIIDAINAARSSKRVRVNGGATHV